MGTSVSHGTGCKAALLLLSTSIFLLSACNKNTDIVTREDSPVSISNVAKMLAQLPVGNEQLHEVHNAVSASIENGYDEEYLMKDIFASPGKGVGDPDGQTRSMDGATPLKDLISDWFKEKYSSTKAGDDPSADEYLSALSSSDMQIYWPYSEDWDGKSKPLLTFDPGYYADSNVAYEMGENGMLKEVTVTEELARTRPVWVVNRNDDSAYKTLEMFQKDNSERCNSQSLSNANGKTLYLQDFTMLRHYDCWLAGASEFFVKCGAIEDFTASTEAEMRLYSPHITDFMVVVKRKQLGKVLPVNTILVSNLTEQMESLAFLITEDDGGSRTTWKCSAVVKIKSKSYGFEMELPMNSRDDIVWRGALSSHYFSGKNTVEGTFGGVKLTFALE